jgi:hypothetical protein
MQWPPFCLPCPGCMLLAYPPLPSPCNPHGLTECHCHPSLHHLYPVFSHHCCPLCIRYCPWTLLRFSPLRWDYVIFTCWRCHGPPQHPCRHRPYLTGWPLAFWNFFCCLHLQG